MVRRLIPFRLAARAGGSLNMRFGIMLGGMVVASLALFSVFVVHTLRLAEERIEQSGIVLARTLAVQTGFDMMMNDAVGMLEKLDVLLDAGAVSGGAFFDQTGGAVAHRLPEGQYVDPDQINEPSARWDETADGAPILVSFAPIANEGTDVRLGTVAIIVPADALVEQQRAATVVALVLALVIALLGAGVLFIVRRTVVRPVDDLRRAAGAVASGDLDVRVDNRRRDEVGQLARSFNAMVRASAENRSALERASEHAEEARRDAESLQREAEAEREHLRVQFERISEVVTAVTHGDLTRRLEVVGDDDVSRLMAQVNAMIHDLAGIIARVHQAGTRLSDAASRVATSAEEMSAGASDQARQTTEVAAAVEEMSATIAESSRNAQRANETARRANDAAHAGERAFQSTAQGMQRVADIVRESAGRVAELGRSGAQIGEIIRVIGDIADQTNLLALNAAIEAARAGDQGRGFAVVADEVRKLAERTTAATKEIASMITRIQKNTEEVVTSMQRGDREVETGLRLADDAGQAFEAIVGAIDDVVGMIDHIAAAAEQQSVSSAQIASHVESIAGVAGEVSRATSDLARTSETMSHQAADMGVLIERFRVEEERYAPRRDEDLSRYTN